MRAPLITALPSLPSAAGTFAGDADAFLAALPDLIDQANELAAYRAINDPTVELDGLAGSQAPSIAEWVSGATYARGDTAWSPISWLDYVRSVAGAGTTDPSADAANWQLLTGSGDASTTGTEALSNKTWSSPALDGAITEDVYTITDGASVDIDPANGSIQIWELDANRTPTATNFANGQGIVLMVWDALWTITWSTISVHWVNGSAPILDAGKYAVVVLWKDGGTVYGKFVGNAGRAPTLFLDFLHGEALDSRVTASGGANGTRVNSSGLIVSASCPRYDYDPSSLAAKGLLIEEARTNLAYPSEQFDHANWGKSGISVTANAGTSPDGATTADKLIPDGTSAKHWVQFGWSATVQQYTGAVFAKASGYNVPALGMINNGANGGDAVNLTTGTVVSGTTNSPFSQTAGLTIASAGNSFSRPSITRTPNGAGNFYFAIYVLPDGSNYHSAGDTTSGFLGFGAQVEAGAFSTSYIPTTSGSVTRSADGLSMTSTNFSSWFNASEGTFVIEYDLIPSAMNRVLLDVNDGTANEEMTLSVNSSNAPSLVIWDGAVAQVNMSNSAISLTGVHRTAFAYKLNDFALCTDGGTVATDTSGTLPTVTRMDIGKAISSLFMNGHARRIAYYNQRLVNSELQRLTG
jgi:hypothetical protein